MRCTCGPSPCVCMLLQNSQSAKGARSVFGILTTFLGRIKFSTCNSLLHCPERTVRSLISGGSFWLTHCPQICVRKEISRPGFLDVNRYSVVHSIDLRRVFLRYVNISMCPGLYGGLYGQNLPYKFKKSYGDFQNRNFEKSHRTRSTGPRSDLRPDS